MISFSRISALSGQGRLLVTPRTTRRSCQVIDGIIPNWASAVGILKILHRVDPARMTCSDRPFFQPAIPH